jgi:hypothetical protein
MLRGNYRPIRAENIVQREMNNFNWSEDAHELNLDTIYGIDSTPFSRDLKEKVPEVYSELIKDFDFQSSDPMKSIFQNG